MGFVKVTSTVIEEYKTVVDSCKKDKDLKKGIDEFNLKCKRRVQRKKIKKK